MNLVEQLLKADASRADELEEKVIKSKKLATPSAKIATKSATPKPTSR